MIKRGSIVAYNGKRFRSFTKVADIKGNQIIAGDSICSIDNGKWVPTRSTQ